MTLERFQAYAFENGRIAGEQNKAIEAARSFYANGVSVELIAKSLNMTIEQVKKIISDIEITA